VGTKPLISRAPRPITIAAGREAQYNARATKKASDRYNDRRLKTRESSLRLGPNCRALLVKKKADFHHGS